MPSLRADDAGKDVVSSVFDQFGFAQGGVVDFQGEVEPAGATVLVALFRKAQWDEWHDLLSRQANLLRLLCQFPSTMRVEGQGKFNFTYTIPARDQYTMQVLSCKGGTQKVTGFVKLLNPSLGEANQHLSLEFSGVVTMYSVLTVAYAVMLCAWLWVCQRHPEQRMRVHYAMAATGAIRVLELVMTALFYADIGKTGEVDVGLNATKQLAESLSTLAFLGVLLLLALGWNVTREHLSLKERQSIAAACVIYIFISTLKAFCTSPQLCGAYVLAEYVIRSLIMLAVIVAMNFNITALRQNIHESPWAPSLPTMYNKVDVFSRFRWAFLGYLLVPTVLLIVKITVLSWRFEWVDDALTEMLFVYVYARVGFIFRPAPPLDFNSVASSVEEAQPAYVGVGGDEAAEGDGGLDSDDEGEAEGEEGDGSGVRDADEEGGEEGMWAGGGGRARGGAGDGGDVGVEMTGARPARRAPRVEL